MSRSGHDALSNGGDTRSDPALPDEGAEPSARQLAAIGANSPGIIYLRVLHTDGRIEYTYVSEAIREIYGLEPEQVVTDSSLLLDTFHLEDRNWFEVLLRESAQACAPWPLEFRVIGTTGEVRWMNGNATPHRRPNGNVVWDGLFIDITERKRAEEQINRLAFIDPLTGLADRNHFHHGFDDALKPVNDTYGHPVGDALLEEVAARLRKDSRKTDTVARLGGGEFAVVVFDPADREAAFVPAGRIIERLSAAMIVEGREVRTGASIGISVLPCAGEDQDELTRNADLAPDQARQGGGTRIDFFDDSSAAAEKVVAVPVATKE